MHILVRPASEITIKSTRVRAWFQNRLVENIRAALRFTDSHVKIDSSWGRVFIELDNPASLFALTKVFGIGSLSVIEHRSAPTVEAMSALAAVKYKDDVSGKSFAVRAKRSDVPGFTSLDVERQLGSVLLPYARKVDLTAPEITIHVEIRPEGAFFYLQTIKGQGGLPLGVEGKALCLLSGGFDSAVSAWMMMRRGVSCDFIFFNLAGNAYESSVLMVAKYLSDEWIHGYGAKIHVISFQDVAEAIKLHVKKNYAQVVLKRLMYRTASRLAEQLGLPALVTGESIGQVSSQTLTNLCAIESASTLPIFRPLIAMDKVQIIDQAKKIGTFIFSEHIQEHCSLVAKYPVTEASLSAAEYHESVLGDVINIDRLCSEGKTIVLKQLNAADLVTNYLFKTEILSDVQVIDCGPDYSFKSWHYPNALHMSPELLQQTYKSFDKHQTYILYCPFGSQSAVMAEKMQRFGFDAYSFRGGKEALKKYTNSLSI